MYRKVSVLLLAALLGMAAGCDGDGAFDETLRFLPDSAVSQDGSVQSTDGTTDSVPAGARPETTAPGSNDAGDAPPRKGDAAQPPDTTADPEPTTRDPNTPGTGPQDADPQDGLGPEPPAPGGPVIGVWRFVDTQTGAAPMNDVVSFEVEFTVGQDAKEGLVVETLRYDAVLRCEDTPGGPSDILDFLFEKDTCSGSPIVERRARACPDSSFSFEINFLRADFARMTITSHLGDCPDWGDRGAIKVDVRPAR